MSKPNKRRIVMEKFKAQVAEEIIGEDGLVEVDLPMEERVWVKITLPFSNDEDYLDRLRAAEGARESCLVILGEHPEHSAEDQWAKWEAAGYTEDDLAMLVKAETAKAKEKQDGFRYRG